MWAGQREDSVEKAMVVGVSCRQVTGLCMGEDGGGRSWKSRRGQCNNYIAGKVQAVRAREERAETRE